MKKLTAKELQIVTQFYVGASISTLAVAHKTTAGEIENLIRQEFIQRERAAKK